MKKLATLVAFSVLAVLIVLPVVSCVNHSAGNVSHWGTLSADGVPAPPPWPPSVKGQVLVADGVPAPPPWPPQPLSWAA